MINYLYGFFYSAVVGHIFIYLLSKQLHSSVRADPNLSANVNPKVLEFNKKWSRHPQMVGFLERILFTAAILEGRLEFIGFWVILKSVARWKIWADTNQVGSDWAMGLHGRLVFNIFLICTAFSIAYAFVGAKIIEWYDPNILLGLSIKSIFSAGILIIVTLLFAIWDDLKSD